MDIYLIILIVLAATAVFDLIVGVSNDAVNFLNSAVGSKAAKFNHVMIVASLGVLVGVTFSSGMMEVARSGIFHPDKFTFHDVMFLFAAVMITDIILLDTFNTLGLPTSTTVSLVFEILGAGLAIALIKIGMNNESVTALGSYLNTSSALIIISGIFLSILVAFIFGSLIQYLSRLLFSFRLEKTSKYFGSIFGGIAIAGITYFMLIKGAKGSTLFSKEDIVWINGNAWNLFFISIAGWAFILQLLHWLFKVNVFKVIVMFGTFALAMAFAANDLVNFIGVPLAGLKSYTSFISTPDAIPDELHMGMLKGSVKANTFILLGAGAVMVLSMWFSKKARNVIKTSVDLGRQHEGNERFGSSVFSRAIVRTSVSVSSGINKVMPAKLRNAINKRMDTTGVEAERASNPDMPAFDLVRASVGLFVSSMLIALGTSLKLPLSTTFVTFMVAMGTSLSDKAWGRESAVYRITGVLTIIGGWLITAIVALITAMLFAFALYYGQGIALALLVALAIFILIRTNIYHTKKAKKEETGKSLLLEGAIIEVSELANQSTRSIANIINEVDDVYKLTISALGDEKRKDFTNAIKLYETINNKTLYVKQHVNDTLNKLKSESIDKDYFYIQLVEDLREIAHCLKYIIEPAHQHVENNHKKLDTFQRDELLELADLISILYDFTAETIRRFQTDKIDDILSLCRQANDKIESSRKNQIMRIKKNKTGTRRSLLFFNILSETRILVLKSEEIYRHFIKFIS